MPLSTPFPGNNQAGQDNSAGNIVHLTDQNFDVEISKGITLVDFWAEWCGPCKMVAPTIAKLADEWAGKIKIAKLDTDANPLVSMKLQIMSIPTFIVYVNGTPVKQFSGAMPKEQFDRILNEIWAQHGVTLAKAA